jgi:PhoH-like ATPase
LNNKPIIEYDLEYKPENYCYSFLSPDGNSCYAYICNERIQIINEPIWKGMKVKPLNLGQKFAVAGMLDPTFDIVYLNAIAGSGKTLLSLAAGMREVDIGKYDKILYIRNSIESLDKGEEVGFLSGNDEKFRIYNYPLYDSLDFISSVGSTKKEKSESSGEERIEELITKYQIQTLWVGALRGRSLDNAFVIIDEQQNISKKTMQTILTRIGKNCKVVLIGSSNQIDNLYINKYTNADSIIREALKEKNEYVRIFATKLNKVVRGSITEFAERLFTTSLKD